MDQTERIGTNRIEAFSDGVFAIAITLLILGIEVPRRSHLGPDQTLTSVLLGLWPYYLGFVTSFATILAMWVNHHRIFTFVGHPDHQLLYWNGLLLLLITFLPFPTALLEEYLLHPEAKVAAAVYAGTNLAIALAFQGLWHHASKHGRLLEQNIDVEKIHQITDQYHIGPFLYLAAFSISFVSAEISVAICLGLAIFLGFRGWPTKARLLRKKI